PIYHDKEGYNVEEHIKGNEKRWHDLIRRRKECGPVMQLLVRSLQHYIHKFDYLPEKIVAYSNGGATKHVLITATRNPNPLTEKERRDELDAAARKRDPFFRPKEPEQSILGKVGQSLAWLFHGKEPHEIEAEKEFPKLKPEAEEISEKDAKRMLFDRETRVRGFKAGGIHHHRLDDKETQIPKELMSFELFDKLLFYCFVHPEYIEFFRRGIRYMIDGPWHVTNRDGYWGERLLEFYEGVPNTPEEPIASYPYDKMQIKDGEMFKRIYTILLAFDFSYTPDNREVYYIEREFKFF
ncbi:hypothetical protein ENBRE01_3030, partial [Enteropsectra breve]